MEQKTRELIYALAIILILLEGLLIDVILSSVPLIIIALILNIDVAFVIWRMDRGDRL